MIHQIKNKIIKTEKVKWRELEWLQTDLKDLSDEAMKKLKRSIISNGFTAPFHVWDSGETIYILDGCHRQRVLRAIERDGFEIPELLPANFVKCKDKRQAAKMVLLFSSIYAKVVDEGIQGHIESHELNINSIMSEIELPIVDVETLLETPSELDSPQEEELKYFEKVHILISFPPDKLIEIQGLIDALREFDFVEYEQSSN